LSWNGPGPAPYRDDETLVNVGDDFYSTRFYTERMIEYIDGQHQDGAPFFAYLAYTAPHWPLQAPRESIARFESWYDDGYEAIYRRRLARAKELGLAPADFAGIPPIEGQPAWDELSDEERRIESRKMEIYAAMISDLDRYVGDLVAYLESIGELDDTFIMFFSDNGPEATRRDLVGATRAWVERCCDNGYANLGAGDSYVMYGPNWARASSAPFRRAKATAFEGGTHVPAFARYPGRIASESRSDAFATVMDVLPTLLELADTEHPGTRYEGRAVLRPQGRSMLPVLTGRRARIRADDDFTGWELYGHRAIRRDDWKIVWDPGEGETATWRLFNLADDRGEQHDLSAAVPDKLAELERLWDRYARDNGVILAR
jgi:arylsulfatase